MSFNIYSAKILAYRAISNIVGRNCLECVLWRIRLRHYRKQKCIFVHIPKAAGTSVACAVYGRRLGHNTAGEIRNAVGPLLFRSLFKFAVVRNPWDRLYSAYRFAVNGGSEGAVANPGLYRCCKCSTFERFVMEWMPAANITQVDRAFLPQVAFTHDKGVQLVDFVGKVEALDKAIMRIEATLNRRCAVEWRNVSRHKGAFRAAYNREMVEVVARVYADDIRAFDYEF